MRLSTRTTSVSGLCCSVGQCLRSRLNIVSAVVASIVIVIASGVELFGTVFSGCGVDSATVATDDGSSFAAADREFKARFADASRLGLSCRDGRRLASGFHVLD